MPVARKVSVSNQETIQRKTRARIQRKENRRRREEWRRREDKGEEGRRTEGQKEKRGETKLDLNTSALFNFSRSGLAHDSDVQMRDKTQ